jgi:hypothetical protein
LAALTLLDGDGRMTMTTTEPGARATDDLSIGEQKRLALTRLDEAWDHAMADGVEPEVMAHAALFAALADLVATYGEEAVAGLAESLPRRIRALEFTIDRTTIQ